MLDYDTEAALYDETRGGVPRAEAAAQAVLALVPDSARTLLDIACGTGIVTARMHRPGLRVLGADAAYGMARKAAERVPGAVVLGDVRRLPFANASLDAVSAVWLLHLVPEAQAVVAEAARVLRPGGVFVTTVDKDAGHDVGSDIDAVLAPYLTTAAFDRADRIEAYGAAHGLLPAGGTHFAGDSQGRSPRRTALALLDGQYVSRLTARGAEAEALAEQLMALPGPDVARPDPSFRLIALSRGLSPAE
ncbi:class I SAM-dependent methyltransferase [Streptomyces beijiangensis]|uniref:Class I SAM-dependent methyltransferase n=1 Tax=Streptomyces beijiangensis TaxID=163361 RepID=A0A939F4F5_9ACTN|nr:class I SAM-dependent methyltransferase [Streptomyces beijiangensis]MBO0511706.1 class I SAM-dependent methyltransferase [Streptomyces beijiangensis]